MSYNYVRLRPVALVRTFVVTVTLEFQPSGFTSLCKIWSSSIMLNFELINPIQCFIFISLHYFQGFSVTSKKCFKQNSMTRNMFRKFLTYLKYNWYDLKQQIINQSEFKFCTVDKAYIKLRLLTQITYIDIMEIC